MAASASVRPWLAASPALRRRRHLAAVLGAPLAALPRGSLPPAAGVVGWGRKANTAGPRRRAAQAGLPFLAVEDGFIRSIGLGVCGAEPFGFVCDRSGIYYDASSPSDLETLIAGDLRPDPAAGALRRRLVALGAGKYNHCWTPPALPPGRRRRLLLADQTRGDLSVLLGGGGEGAFARMLALARDEDAELVVKLHPDVVAGRRRGYLAELDLDGCTVLREDCNPMALIQAVDAVWTVTSQLGCEALLAERPVRCFGLPFYAGWGLTRDELECPRRGLERSLDQVFWAAYGIYTRYADPLGGGPCGLDAILERIADHRRVAGQPGGRFWAVGFSLRKQVLVPPWLPGDDLRFVRTCRGALRRGARPGDGVLTWGFRAEAEAGALADRLGTTVARMEDGFLRSVGLGSDLVPARSLVVDRRGIYFDPSGPSDLETLLAQHPFDARERARGLALVARLRASGVGKYNVGRQEALALPPAAGGRRVILVPGQVEDDQSILRGACGIRRDAELLAAVRAAEPDAFLVYKPHPDVLAGNRAGGADPALADLVVRDLALAACLAVVEAVHTMTSLAGFEALVRGIAVHTYGLPFYAGWGLTADRHRCPRRTRRLALEELVYAALVLYPRYRDPGSGLFIGPEAVIDLLAAERAAGGPPRRALLPAWRRWLLKARNALPWR